METISSLTNSASRALWGDAKSKEEPMNGVTGDVSKGEPYDAGNIEHVEGPDVTSANTNSISHNQPMPEDTVNASEIKDSSLANGDHTKAQNDTRSPSDPATNPLDSTTKAKQNVDDSTAGTDDNSNPVKVDGPGPKPISEVAKEYGGDAGNAPSSDESVDKAGKGAETDKKAGMPEEEDGPQTVSHGEGTGEKYVKSSGLKADGGDFDAAAPGAGREADRLLEEKGLHKAGSANATTSTDSVSSNGSNGNGKNKVSLKDKIKAKLHKSSVSA
jgi:hypothetical protein